MKKEAAQNSSEAKMALKRCFSKLMSHSEPIIQRGVTALVDRITLKSELDVSDWLRLNFNFQPSCCVKIRMARFSHFPFVFK